MKQKKKKSWWKGDWKRHQTDEWWIDENGNDYRIPWIIMIAAIAILIFK